MLIDHFVNQGARAAKLLPYAFINIEAGGGLVTSLRAGVRFGADGYIYEDDGFGNFSQVDAWLLKGTSSQFYLSREITSETPATAIVSDPGTLLQMNTNRDYIVEADVAEVDFTAYITFSISDQSDGSNVLAARSYILQARYTTDGQARL
jgi:hypothetical protein